MSVAQIERELETLSLNELRVIEAAARRQQGRHRSDVLSAPETRLYEIINQPMPSAERFRELEPSWEAGTLSDDERAELLEIVEAREEISAQRLDAVRQLAQLRGESFENLWRQIMGETPQPRLVLG